MTCPQCGLVNSDVAQRCDCGHVFSPGGPTTPIATAPPSLAGTATEKVCPFCAETIKAAAVVCRFCNRDLPAPPPSAVPVEALPPHAQAHFVLVKTSSTWSKDEITKLLAEGKLSVDIIARRQHGTDEKPLREFYEFAAVGAPVQQVHPEAGSLGGEPSVPLLRGQTDGIKFLKYGGLALLALLGVCGYLGIGDSSCKSGSSGVAVGLGDQAYIAGSTTVLVARDQSAYEEFQKAAAAQDTAGTANLLAAGRLFMVSGGTKVLCREHVGVFARMVRILDGPEAGESGIVGTHLISSRK